MTNKPYRPPPKITAVGVTILGRSGQGTGRNYRVAARYTNGVETGSSSTFRTFDMQNGNTSQDSFSGIVAPDGFWITSIAMNSDHGVYAALDDLAFITSDVVPVAPEIAVGLDASYAPYLGDTLTLGVTLAPGASPPPTYQWYLDDVEIDPLLGGTDPTLEIVAGASTDGSYKVVVSNSGGSDESSTTVAHTTNPALVDWFKAYRFRVEDTRSGGNTVQISEFVLSYDGSPIDGGTATNPGGNTPAGEGPVIGGSGGSVTVGAGSFTLEMAGDITTGRMIRTTNVEGSLFTKKGNHRLTLTGTDNRGGGANGNWVIEQGILDLAANQPQFGTIRDGGTVTVKNGASIVVSNFNALHGWDGGGTHYILEAGASMTTADTINSRATRITLKGGELASGTPNALFGSYDLAGNAAERRLVADGGAVTSVISAQDIRLATPAGYIFETVAGTSPSGIDLDVTGTLNGLHGLVKQGDGVMRLGPSVHGYQGNTVVAAGTLRLAGTTPSSPLIRVDAGATLDVSPSYTFGSGQGLAGSGVITGSIAGAGTIAPGASTGTLTVTGNADLSGTTLIVEIDDESSPANDKLAVTGLLDLDGATIGFAVAGTAAAPVYVIATYGTLAGQGNVTILGLPDGYTPDFAYNSGTAIALVSDAAANFDSWAAANGIAGQPFGGDFDSDGLSNGLEYAIAGLNPAGPDGSPGSFTGGTLSFTKRPEAVANGDVSYAIETSTTLAAGSWTTVTPDVNNDSTISYTLPTGQGRIFARLKAVQTP